MPVLDRPTLTMAAVDAVATRTPFLDPEVKALPGLVGLGDVCVDVGASAGVYTQAMSRLVGSTGWVHSVEPLFFAHPMWSRLLAAQRRANVSHHEMALGSAPGTATMRVPFTRTGPATSRSFLGRDTHGLGSTADYLRHLDVVVEVGTLDGLVDELDLVCLEFVKLDVEGGELPVLRGGREAIESLRPILLIEIEARHTVRYGYEPQDLVAWLTSRGYDMFVWQGGRWEPADRVCGHAHNYLFRPGG